ncbi:20S proteasome beta subunit PBB2 [Actinidia rufa]|uniref:20S proteasome beta subunit PBB2 n=1 Tax=Actinidia rufa TaxID=165716 RepID=A0A7J0HE04_9ERIC|nr:20S proteasome beta subunit PBB2 [Actinidia rufa]
MPLRAPQLSRLDQSSVAAATPPTSPSPPPPPLLKPSSASPPPPQHAISTKTKQSLYFFVPSPGAPPHVVILDVEERWFLRHLRVPTRILQREKWNVKDQVRVVQWDATRRVGYGMCTWESSEDGVILGAGTRATEGPIVADKNCEKIHFMAPNIYCSRAGTAADTEAVTGQVQTNTVLLDMVSSQLKLHRYHTGRESRVVTALTLLKSHLFSYQGYVKVALVLGGVDVTGPHLYTHMDLQRHCHFATMGSGSLAAMANFESKCREGLTRDGGVNLVTEAICSGIFNDLGSGSNVDVCVITKRNTEYPRNHKLPNPRTYVNAKGYSFTKKTG